MEYDIRPHMNGTRAPRSPSSAPVALPELAPEAIGSLWLSVLAVRALLVRALVQAPALRSQLFSGWWTTETAASRGQQPAGRRPLDREAQAWLLRYCRVIRILQPEPS